MSRDRRRIIMKAFIQSQCVVLLIPILIESRNPTYRISFMVHERNIQTLAIEVFKVVNGISSKIMNPKKYTVLN